GQDGCKRTKHISAVETSLSLSATGAPTEREGTLTPGDQFLWQSFSDHLCTDAGVRCARQYALRGFDRCD
ncbi:hypothetical protein GOODEAATRI_023260, partial [Goodea atripinnis]